MRGTFVKTAASLAAMMLTLAGLGVPAALASGTSNAGTGKLSGWVSDGKGVLHWYENDVMARSHAFYDPASKAWYWADADGTIARDKDVFIPRDESDRSKGGKWVRFDQQRRMVKGLHRQDNAWYYFDRNTGAMAHGNAWVPEWNVWHYFDAATGRG